MANFAEMVRQASQNIGADAPSGEQRSSSESPSGGIQIERHDAEHIQGQAKSGFAV